MQMPEGLCSELGTAPSCSQTSISLGIKFRTPWSCSGQGESTYYLLMELEKGGSEGNWL